MFINLVNINSLNVWVHRFLSFVESIRRECCSYWDQDDDADGNMRERGLIKHMWPGGHHGEYNYSMGIRP